MSRLTMLLAQCSAYDDYTQALMEMHLMDAITCPYKDALGGPLAGTFFMGAIGMAIYIRTHSVLLPFILMLLIGGVFLPSQAAIGIQVVTLIIMFVIGAAPIVFLRRLETAA